MWLPEMMGDECSRQRDLFVQSSKTTFLLRRISPHYYLYSLSHFLLSSHSWTLPDHMTLRVQVLFKAT